MQIRDLCLVALSVLIVHNSDAHFKVRSWTAVTLEEVRLLQTWQKSAVDLSIITGDAAGLALLLSTIISNKWTFWQIHHYKCYHIQTC